MKMSSLIIPTLFAAAVVGYLVFDTNAYTNVDTIPAAALTDHITEGTIVVDNAIMTLPLSTEIKDSYLRLHEDVDIRVERSGNADGLIKFCRGDVGMMVSTRPILSEELGICENRETRFIEIPIGMDATVFVSNGQNQIETLSAQQISAIWDETPPNVSTWPNRPNRRLDLFGPTVSSGEAHQLRFALWANETHPMREDYTQLHDLTDIASNLSTNTNALAFTSYAHFQNYRGNMRTIAVNNIEPNVENISSGLYPYTRFLFFYVNSDAISNSAVLEFVQYYLDQIPTTIEKYKFVPLTNEAYALYRQRLNNNITGTAFLGNLQSGTRLQDIMTAPLCCGGSYHTNPLGAGLSEL